MKYLITKEISFDAAHKLFWYKGKCANLHGHSWIVKVTLEYDKLNQDGITVDFTELKKILEREIVNPLDHTYLNDILTNPTAELIVTWIWKRLEVFYSNLAVIEVFESPTSSVRLERSDVRKKQYLIQMLKNRAINKEIKKEKEK